jgi:hypothetical protein
MLKTIVSTSFYSAAHAPTGAWSHELCSMARELIIAILRVKTTFNK